MKVKWTIVIYWLTCLFADNIFFFFRILKNNSVLQKEWKVRWTYLMRNSAAEEEDPPGAVEVDSPRDHPVLHGGRHSELIIIHGWVGFHFNATWCKSLSISLSFITKFALFRKLLINFWLFFQMSGSLNCKTKGNCVFVLCYVISIDMSEHFQLNTFNKMKNTRV